jgi:hypothetical protein
MAKNQVLRTETVEQLRAQIVYEWNRIQGVFVESAIRIGKSLLRAEETLGAGTPQHRRFIAELPFSPSHANKFRKIADDPTLQNRGNWDKLPQSVYSLYQLTLFPEGEVQQAIASGEITRDTGRADIARLKARDGDYLPFCSIRIAGTLTGQQQRQLTAALSRLSHKYSEIRFSLARQAVEQGLGQLRERAENEYERLVGELPDEQRRHSSLVEHAIRAIRQSSSKTLPDDFGRREQLHRDLGLDLSSPIRLADVHRVVRARRIVCRFVALKSLDPVIAVWMHALAWCDTGKPQALLRFARQGIAGKPTPEARKKKEAVELARRLLAEYQMYLNR